MFTFLPEDECEALCAPGKNPNEAKERLAWEVTALIHGKDEADKALSGAKAAFGGAGAAGGDKSAMPHIELPRSRFETGYNAVDLFTDAGLVPTKSEGRRLVKQGGAFVSGGSAGESAAVLAAVPNVAALITIDHLDKNGELILRAGKKRYCRVITG
jgi:tyrosyl-tRNA synthetase